MFLKKRARLDSLIHSKMYLFFLLNWYIDLLLNILDLAKIVILHSPWESAAETLNT